MKTMEVIGGECVAAIPQNASILKIDIKNIYGIQKAVQECFDTDISRIWRTNVGATFDGLMRIQDQNDDRVRRFLSGYERTHTTTRNMSMPLISRLVMASAHAASTGEHAKAEFLMRAANFMVNVAAEDQGLKGPHAGLYPAFGKAASGDTQWMDHDRYFVPACERFSEFTAKTGAREKIPDAILVTAASEFSNAVEYTVFAQEGAVRPWISRLNPLFKNGDTKRAAAYVTVHGGPTEYAHFLNAVAAWQTYNEAMGLESNPERLTEVFVDYQNRVGHAFEALRSIVSAPKFNNQSGRPQPEVLLS